MVRKRLLIYNHCILSKKNREIRITREAPLDMIVMKIKMPMLKVRSVRNSE